MESCETDKLTASPWVGFNLTDFIGMHSLGAARYDDIRLISRLGFNFIRIPLNYRLWDWGSGRPQDVTILSRIDKAVATALDAGLHVCLALHRAPGYTVSRDGREPKNLWKDEKTQIAFQHTWRFLSERYLDLDSDIISFNLINEPGEISTRMSRQDHDSVICRTIEVVRNVRADRQIIIDGLNFGREPHPSLLDKNVWQSCRGYDPFVLTHFGTARQHKYMPAVPAWPLEIAGKGVLDRDWLRQRFQPWSEIISRGAQVHCGEFGCTPNLPHDVMLAWMNDLLSVYQDLGIGFALWNFRGPFGVVDSGRAETIYNPTFSGRLDCKLLDLLRNYAEFPSKKID